MKKNNLLLALLALTLGASSLLAQAPDTLSLNPTQVEPQGLQHRLCVKIFEATKKILENVTARITRAESVDLNLNSCTMDERHRIFVDLDGMVELKFDRDHPHITQKMEEMEGQQTQTNGPLCTDFMITQVEKIADREYHVEFKLGLILVMDEILSKLVKFGTQVVGTVTLMGIGNDLLSFLNGIDSDVLAHSLDDGFKDLTKVVMSLAGVEGYNAIRELDPKRQGDQQGGSVAGAVMAHLALALVKGTARVALETTGMTLGAAVGVAMSPAIGATVGAVIGAASFAIVGNVIHRKLTVDMPMKYRLARIKRLHKLRVDSSNEFKIAYYTAKIEKYEGKILKRVSLEMRTDQFRFLEEFMQQVRATDPKEREPLVPLWHKLQSKLRFEVVEHNDQLAQRMLDQLTAVMGQ